MSKYRRILLLLLVVILPCAVVIGLGLRTLGHERELAEKRLADERTRLAADVSRLLARELEELVQGGDEALAVPLRSGEIQPPWKVLRPMSASGSYRSLLEQGEEHEFRDRDLTAALRVYRRAAEAAQDPFESATALLATARVHVKLENQAEGTRLFEQLLATPAAVVDQDGVPFALYAAARLVDLGSPSAAVHSRLRNSDLAEAWHRPEAVYMLHAIVEALPSSDVGRELREQVERRLGLTELIMTLQRTQDGTPTSASKLGHAPVEATPEWQLSTNDRWLFATLATPEGDRLVVAAAQLLFERFEEDSRLAATELGGFQFVRRGPAEEPVGAIFPDLGLRFDDIRDPVASDLWPQRRFYIVSLFSVVALTLLGAALLWRDVRRDVEVAEMRSQFVSSVSHELRTPLTSIRMFAETLRDQPIGTDVPADEFLDIIIGESERLTRLLDNVLNFSKIERGSKRYRMDSMRLHEVVKSAQRALEYSLVQHGFELTVDVDEDLPAARADHDALEQAVLNLLTNAVKYADGDRRVELRLRREGQFGVIEVTDHGVGIQPEERERIFEPFYRARNPEHAHVQGAGLGLALVRHIAEAHKGEVTVESTPGGGSTFSLKIPLEVDAP